MAVGLNNALLTRVSTVVPSQAGGPPAVTPGPPRAVRCLLDGPSFEDRRTLDADQLDGAATLVVRVANMADAAAAIVRDARVTVRPDGGPTPLTWRVDRAEPMPFGGVSHVTAYLRAV